MYIYIYIYVYINIYIYIYIQYICLYTIQHNTKTTDLVTWPLKRKLVESMEYTDAWCFQQGVKPIEGSTHVRLYCCRY